jgi:hypothetical protein
MAKLIQQKTLVSDGEEFVIEQGRISIPKGKALKGIFLVTDCTIVAGSTAVMTAAEKRNFFNAFLFDVRYGAAKQHIVFASVGGDIVRQEARFAAGRDVDGVSNDSSGLQQSFGTTPKACRVIQFIPLGLLARLQQSQRKLFGMGRSQAASAEIKIKRNTSVITGNFSLTGNVTLQAWPYFESRKGDVNGLVPEFSILTTSSNAPIVDKPGLVLRFAERTAAAAASTLANLTVKIDEEVYSENAAPADILRESKQAPSYSTHFTLEDVETPLIDQPEVLDLRLMQTGRPQLIQGTVNLATVNLGLLTVPIKPAGMIKADISDAAKFRNKPVKAVNGSLMEGLDLPERTKALPFYQLADADDSETKFPGLAADRSGNVVIDFGGYKALANAQRDQLLAQGNRVAAEKTMKQLAAMVPGAAIDGRGIRSDSDILAAARS